MANERYPHLFLPGPTETHDDYRSPRRGGSSPRLRVQDRAEHAEYISGQLESAWQTAGARQAVAHANRQGVYLEFSSEPGFDLILNSLENRTSGIRLLNARKVDVQEGEITRATVFVPQGQSSYFLKKVREYATKDNPPKRDGSRTPKNASLVNSIGDVRAAILETSFWQDAAEKIPGDSPDWVEVWLNTEDLHAIESFSELCTRQDIQIGEGQLTFPERTVLLIKANRVQLTNLIEFSEWIAEFRGAREVASFFVEMENRDQVDWVEDIIARSDIRNIDQVVVLVLDHGVNNGHRLLEPLLAIDDCHTVNPAWGVHDHDGHGTLMAGTIAYGDLMKCLEGNQPIVIRHGLESAKILPPPPEENPKRLWGYFTSQGVSRAEIQAPHRKRIICMAVTSEDDLTRGRPTSWSGQIDEMASGYADDQQRFIILSAGNVVDPNDWAVYPESNMTREIQDPAQAWNALTVGAFTEKTRIVDPALDGYRAIAEQGDLSPFSSTSMVWPDRKWPIKPEVLFEGGNVAINDAHGGVVASDDLKLLSTFYEPHIAQFAPFDATSAASAQAANMAAQIQAEYPDAWPETVRALIVHSAEWTEIQKGHFLRDETKTSYYQLTKICGYGVPSFERAMSCAKNALSLISQAHIQPFDREGSRYVSKDMHVYRLPWPEEVLRDLGETPISMRVTLSYFIEPSPGEIGWKDRYRYASHGLRFELNGPGESETDFVQRINRKAREDEEHPGTEGPNAHWKIGEARNVGSIHSDIWEGTASQLASSNLIAIHPAVGWWRERAHLGKYNKLTRYTLVVSFVLPEQDIDIYTPVSVRLGIPTQVPIVI